MKEKTFIQNKNKKISSHLDNLEYFIIYHYLTEWDFWIS